MLERCPTWLREPTSPDSGRQEHSYRLGYTTAYGGLWRVDNDKHTFQALKEGTVGMGNDNE